MGEKDTTERLATLETKMDLILQSVKDLNNTLRANYVPRSELELRFQGIEREMAEFKGELSELKRAPGKWVDRAMAIGGVAIAMLAFIYKK